MRVIIDGTILCRRHHTRGGQQRYVRELLRHLPGVPSDNEYLVWFNFSHPGNMPLYRQVCDEMIAGRETYRSVLCRIPPQALNTLRVPIELFAGPADVLHVPHSGCPGTWRAKRVVTIHDLIYYDHPECFTHNTEKWKRDVQRISRQADLILTVSEYVRETVMERLHVHPDRVRAIYHGVSPAFLLPEQPDRSAGILARYGIRPPYLLFVGTVQPNKNLQRLLEAFAMVRTSSLREWMLVIVGQQGWLAAPIFQTVESRGLGSAVVWTDFVSDAVLASLYRHADLFVLPSLLEGFGIPAIEAMECGVPVVVSKTGSLPEVVGDAGVFIDPFSVEDIARGLHEAATDQRLREKLTARGKCRAAGFRWERTARETVAAYRDAAEMP